VAVNILTLAYNDGGGKFCTAIVLARGVDHAKLLLLATEEPVHYAADLMRAGAVKRVISRSPNGALAGICPDGLVIAGWQSDASPWLASLFDESGANKES